VDAFKLALENNSAESVLLRSEPSSELTLFSLAALDCCPKFFTLILLPTYKKKKNCLKHILRIQHLLKVELVCFDPILSMSDSIFPTTQGKINTFCACSIKDV